MLKIVLQRVKEAKVNVDGESVGVISQGLLLLIGFHDQDQRESMAALADKVIQLRIFEDDAGKMNRSLVDCGGSILSVSQFTLYGDCTKGRRPSFTSAANPDKARVLYQEFNQLLRDGGVHVETGIFGANMEVSLINDGPVTFVLES